jgi:hypothetical protein
MKRETGVPTSLRTASLRRRRTSMKRTFTIRQVNRRTRFANTQRSARLPRRPPRDGDVPSSRNIGFITGRCMAKLQS